LAAILIAIVAIIFNRSLKSKPNKSVKETARRSGWQSQFISKVIGFAVGNHAGSPLP